nr:hypothetical protein [Candidatus Sigynarchaeum springense]
MVIPWCTSGNGRRFRIENARYSHLVKDENLKCPEPASYTSTTILPARWHAIAYRDHVIVEEYGLPKPFPVENGALVLEGLQIRDIDEIEGLGEITPDLRRLDLGHNEITEIKGLDRFTRLETLRSGEYAIPQKGKFFSERNRTESTKKGRSPISSSAQPFATGSNSWIARAFIKSSPGRHGHDIPSLAEIKNY